MECETYREQMSLWLDRQLAAPDVQRLEAHAETCPACCAAFDAMRRVDRLLASAPMLSPAAGFTARFQARLAVQRRRRRTWAGLLTLALAAAAIIAAAGILAAFTGLSVWGSASGSELLTQTVSLLLHVGQALGASLNLIWLIVTALARAIRHPIFIGYMVATAILLAVWTQIVARRVLASRTVTAVQS
jgi:anti-sigma factor RsiW